MNVTFPDGTVAPLDPRAGDVTHVIAVKVEGRWTLGGGFEAGAEGIAEAEANAMRHDRRYEDVQVLAVIR